MFAVKRYLFQTKDGLAFLQIATLDNKVRQQRLSVWSYLMHCSVFEI